VQFREKTRVPKNKRVRRGNRNGRYWSSHLPTEEDLLRKKKGVKKVRRDPDDKLHGRDLQREGDDSTQVKKWAQGGSNFKGKKQQNNGGQRERNSHEPNHQERKANGDKVGGDLRRGSGKDRTFEENEKNKKNRPRD